MMGFLSDFDNAINFLCICWLILIVSNLLILLSRIFKRKIPRRIRLRKWYRYLPLLFCVLDISFLIISFTTIQYNFTASPVVANKFPSSNETWYDFSKPLSVTFDRPFKPELITTNIFPTVKGEWKVEQTGSFIKFPRRISFYPSQSFGVDQKITIYFNKIQNLLATKNGFDHEDSFKSPTLPNIVATNPQDKSTLVPVTSAIDMKLDNPDGPFAIWSVKLSPDVSLKLTETSYDHMQIKFDRPLAQNTSYTLTVNQGSAIYDFNSKNVINKTELKVAKTIQFKTVPNPTISNSSPNGSNVDPSSPIEITFNEEMDKTSVEKNFSISPRVSGEFSWANSKTLKFYPSNSLTKGTEYIVKLSPGIASKVGGVVENEIWFDFGIIGQVKVSSYSPSQGTTNVSPNNPIEFTFDQDIDHDFAQSKFISSPKANGNFTWRGNTMIFTPVNMSFSTSYTFTESSGVKSINGLDSSASFNLTITIQPDQVTLNVPQYYQIDKYDCNLTATRMVLAYRNIYVTQDDIVSKIGYAQPQDRNGNVWGDPSIGFVGYRNGPGYGMHWGPISKYISETRQNKIYTSWNISGIAHEIAKGNPVIVWWNNGLSGDGPDTWTTINGTTINGYDGMHSEVVTGFNGSADNPTGFILNDPWRGRRNVDIGNFNSLWSTFNNTAIAIY